MNKEDGQAILREVQLYREYTNDAQAHRSELTFAQWKKTWGHDQ